MPGIFDRGPSAILGELLGGVFGGQAQAGPAQAVPLPQRNPAQNQVPDPNGVVEFMEANGIPFTDGGIETAIRIMSQQQGLTPSQDVIDQSIFGPAGGAAAQPQGFNPALSGPNPLTPGGGLPIEPEDTGGNQQALDTGELVRQDALQNPQGDFAGNTGFDRFGSPQFAPGITENDFARLVPVDRILSFAEENKIPLTDGGIHEAAKAVMGDQYNEELVDFGIRSGHQ